jgi:hypothetical protein
MAAAAIAQAASSTRQHLKCHSFTYGLPFPFWRAVQRWMILYWHGRYSSHSETLRQIIGCIGSYNISWDSSSAFRFGMSKTIVALNIKSRANSLWATRGFFVHVKAENWPISFFFFFFFLAFGSFVRWSRDDKSKGRRKLVRNKTKSFDYAHPTRFVAVGIPI